MKRIAMTAAVLSFAAIATAAGAGADPLGALLEGNGRFAAGRPARPDQTPERRAEVAKAQKPFAVVVGCADSRVPPEVVFDQGLGDVFVVRVAGNVVDDTALGSIEFAVAKLGARLIVVLGHERCGAVEAALAGGEVPGHVGAVVRAIAPNVSHAREEPGDPLDNAVRDNVRAVSARLREASPVLAPLVADGSLRVVGAVYDLDSGAVAIVDPGPEAAR